MNSEKRRSNKVLDTFKKEYRRTSTAHRGEHKTERGVGVFVVVGIENFLRSSKAFHHSRVAHESGALRMKDLARVTVDTTVNPLAAAAPARLELYSFHAPEVECIGKGKASAPYEFGVKASIITTNARAPGGQFVLHARTLPSNPYDGHTLGSVIEAAERLTGREIERAYVDKGYRGHNAANPRRVFISGQKRGVFGRIKRELRRRSAIEAVIGHMKAEGHLGRCFSKVAPAMPPTSSSAPSVTTFASFSHG
jgi:hypothetical protein